MTRQGHAFCRSRPKNKPTEHAAITALRRAIHAAKALLFFPLLVIASAVPSSAEPRQRAVLVLYQSITTGLPAYEQISDNFRSTLDAAVGNPIAIYEESLDLSRFEGPAYLKIIEQYLRNKYSAIPIGAIVTIGARAFEYALPLRSGPWGSTPIIFAALSDSSIDMPARPPNVTGLTLRSSPADYVAAARALVPELKQVVLVGDPLERQTFRSHFASELPAATAGLTLIDLTGLPLAEVRKRVSSLPENSAILYTSINIDGGGQVITPRRALEALVQVANRPIVIDVATNIGAGAAGGFVVLPAEIGKGAAELTLRILAGEDANSIPIEFQRNAVKPVFDWRQLQRFGVSKSALPAGSEIRFRNQPVWQSYRWQIIAVLFAIAFQSALIVWIFVEDRYRRHAEKKAIELGAELAHISRFATAGELSASIAHEIRQPLAAIVASASACLNFLKAKEPDLATVRQAQQSIVNEGRRADHVLDNVRAMFRKESLPHEPININSIIHDVIAIVRRKLELSGIAVSHGPHDQSRAHRVGRPHAIAAGSAQRDAQCYRRHERCDRARSRTPSQIGVGRR